MSRHYASGFCLLSLLVAVGSPAQLPAQEVRWRSDYNEARKEARDRGVPLLVNVSGERCPACQRMDAITFRHAALAALLNEQVVALKLDGNRQPNVVEALGVQVYPTLILARPTGQIVRTLQGYVDASQLDQLTRQLVAENERAKLPAAGGEPQVESSRDYLEAAAALEAGDYPAALNGARRVLEAEVSAATKARAVELLARIEHHAAARLATLRALSEQGQGELALEALSTLAATFAGTPAAADATALAALLRANPTIQTRGRERRAREQLLLAREEFRSKQFLACLERCETLVAQCSDLVEGAEAAILAAAIKDHPERLQVLTEATAERLGGFHLLLAESLLRQGRPAEAAAALGRAVRQLPGTQSAVRAQVRLGEVQALFPRETAEGQQSEGEPK